MFQTLDKHEYCPPLCVLWNLHNHLNPVTGLQMQTQLQEQRQRAINVPFRPVSMITVVGPLYIQYLQEQLLINH